MATGSAVREDAAKQKSAVPAAHELDGAAHAPTVPLLHMQMPDRGHLMWYGGLAAAAVFGVVDWPVVALIGAGSWVAEHYAKAAQHPTGDRQAQH